MATYRNAASGHSQVGAQIGMVRGDVTFTAGKDVSAVPPELSEDLTTRLANIEAAIEHFRRQGDLSTEDATSALNDVVTARDLLPLEDTSQARRFETFMKRIAGVVSGTAELSTTVAEAVSAVQATL